MTTENKFIDEAIENIIPLADIYIGDITGNSDFKKSLLDMVNLVSNQNYILLTTDFISPVRTPIGSIRNSKVTLLQYPNTNILNITYVWYNRIHTSDLGIITLPKNNAFSVSDLIVDINAALGTSILKSELEDFTLPNADNAGRVTFELLFNKTSFRYYSGENNVIINPTPTPTPTTTPTPTPAPTTTPYPGTGSGSKIETFRNVSGEPMPRGTPVFSSGSREVDKAVGTFAKHRVIGLNTNTEPLLPGVNGNFVVDGTLICTALEWQEITGTPGGLQQGRKYFLDTAFTGKLRLNVGTTNILPGSYLVCVGYAITETELKLEVQPPVRLT